jgi:hypothetical protein
MNSIAAASEFSASVLKMGKTHAHRIKNGGAIQDNAYFLISNSTPYG